MIQINLLPWRDQEYELTRNNLFKLCGIFSTFTIIILMIIFVYYKGQVNIQVSRNNFLKAQIQRYSSQQAALSSEVKRRTEFKQQIDRVIVLHKNKEFIVRFLNELVMMVPSSIQLNKMSLMKKEIILNGSSEKYSDITKLLENIDKLNFISHAQLTRVSQDEMSKNETFDFSISIVGAT